MPDLLLKAAVLVKISGVRKWRNKEFARQIMYNGLTSLKHACVNLIFNRQSKIQQESQPFNNNNETTSSIDSDNLYYGIAEDVDPNNKDAGLLLDKFESDVQIEINMLKDIFSSVDVMKNIKNTKEFWRANKITLPILYEFATVVLSIPASSAYIERFFSFSGVVCTNRKLNMKDDLIILRSLLKANFKHLFDLNNIII